MKSRGILENLDPNQENHGIPQNHQAIRPPGRPHRASVTRAFLGPLARHALHRRAASPRNAQWPSNTCPQFIRKEATEPFSSAACRGRGAFTGCRGALRLSGAALVAVSVATVLAAAWLGLVLDLLVVVCKRCGHRCQGPLA